MLAAIGLYLFWATVFGIAFTQWPLYSENQNTKFLIGLARSGYGYLGEDWLAHTVDPLPAFSWLVSLTYSLFGESLFYFYHALLLGIYLYSLVGIAGQVFPAIHTKAARTVLAVLVIALHASLLPPFSFAVLGTSMGWLLQSGVANQYLVNPVFQPSTFGVLLILSIFLFLRKRPYWATLAASLAAVFHSTYLPSAGVLTFSYLVITFLERRSDGKSLVDAALPALAIGGLGLLVVLPVLLYNVVMLGPTSAEAWRRAQDIIVNFRIPHHSLPELWIDQTVYAKVAIVLLALVLIRKTKLFPILLIAFLAAVLLTMVQVMSGSDTLAFVAPWRISVFLVPLSSTMIMAFLVAKALELAGDRTAQYEGGIISLSLVVLVALVLRGALAMRDSFQARHEGDEAGLLQFVHDSKAARETYLVPTHMAEFRLATGAPVVVTFKSHPYKDVEVIEWQERVLAVNDFYGEPSCERLMALAGRYGVSHAVLPRSQLESGCPGAQELYRDDHFRMVQLATVTTKTK